MSEPADGGIVAGQGNGAMAAGGSLAGRRNGRAGQDSGDPGDRYKWLALSNTTLGMLAATVNASIVIISLPAIFRGIKLDPLKAGNVSYLLWMLMGYLVVSAVLVVTLGTAGRHLRPGQDVQRGLRDLRARRAGAAIRPVHRRVGRAVADRLPGRAGGRRGHADGQRPGHPDRRVPLQSARHGDGHQPGRRHLRHVHRPDPGRHPGRSRTGGWCSSSRCRSASAARSGPT